MIFVDRWSNLSFVILQGKKNIGIVYRCLNDYGDVMNLVRCTDADWTRLLSRRSTRGYMFYMRIYIVL